MIKVALSILLISSVLFAGYGDYVPGYVGYPNYQERIIHVWTNICRTSPVAFRDSIIVPGCTGSQGIFSIYPAVQPVYWSINLNRSSRYHSKDLADYNFFSHKSHDSTAADVRVAGFYPGYSWFGENIAAGNSSPILCFKQWIIETKECPPAVDGSGDGHRRNIMNYRYNQIGVGYAYNSSADYRYYWTQDFVGNASPYKDRRLVSGSHDYSVVQNKITFLVNYYDSTGKAPSVENVVVDGVVRSMALWMGTSSRGTYRLDLAKGTSCRNYFFSYTDGDGVPCRYPEEGDLVTYGEGSCLKDYLPPESLAVQVSGGARSGITQCLIGRELHITASSPEFIPLRTEIVDILGRRVVSKERTVRAGNKLAIRLPGTMPAGVYVVRYFLPGNIVKSFRFVLFG